MGMQCDVCGKKPVVGNQKTYRGKAKYLGGVGKKITGTSRRTFKPNLQRIQVVKDGKTVRASVCVQCIRSPARSSGRSSGKPFADVRSV